MGRPYKQELNAIESTYKYTENFDISKLIPFFSHNCDHPLLIIGSGGSYAVAKNFELCYQRYGGFAKTVTPYELQNEKYVIGNSKILIVTAGGNNPDTVGVYEYTRLYEPFEICVICMSKKSKISKLISKNKDAILFEGDIPFGKDGYLAVNSSVAMFGIVKKLMDFFELNENNKININRLERQRKEIGGLLEKCTNIIVVYGGWGAPAACDLESKCSEAGLISVQYVDYRNFAHGRHNWIDKMPKTTSIVAISSAEERLIREKTLSKLPSELPRIFLASERKGSLASLELLIQVFYLVDILGDIRKIDPGRPQVPEYGSQLYHIKYNLRTQDKYLKSIVKDTKEYCIYRKKREIQDSRLYEYYDSMYDKFINELCREKYGALILDFDGTIVDNREGLIADEIAQKLNDLLSGGIIIGFATGRGDSIIMPLQKIIQKEFWGNVYIGFYNGSFIGDLEGKNSLKEGKSENLEKFYGILEQIPLIKDKLVDKGYQLSIRERDAYKLEFYFELINEIMYYYKISNVNICRSGHAVDIIGKGCSKQRLVEYIREKQLYNVLCIGDEGIVYENDFNFLSLNNALSVDHQNILGRSGWNLAPAGCRGVNATKYYFEKMMLGEGYFTILKLREE